MEEGGGDGREVRRRRRRVGGGGGRMSKPVDSCVGHRLLVVRSAVFDVLQEI